MTVHFVHRTNPRAGTSRKITAELAARLRARYRVEVYDQAQREPRVIRPEPGDVLIGHPTRYDGRKNLFQRSFDEPGWAKRIVFAPFSHGMPLDGALIDPLVEEADLFLAMCGPYWFETMGSSLFSHWAHKTRRCDVTVNRALYPVVKGAFNPPGRRRFLYIGNAGPMKGVDFLAKLAAANRDIDFGWVGYSAERGRPAGVPAALYARLERGMIDAGIVAHGGQEWDREESRDLVATYDFLLSCGRSDSCTITVFEAASWGLVPVVTKQCGYYGDDWIVNVPLDDVEGASRVLRRLNACPAEELEARREAGWRALATTYDWDVAGRQMIDCIEEPVPSTPSGPVWRARRRWNKARLRAIVEKDRVERRVAGTIDRLRRLPGRVLRL